MDPCKKYPFLLSLISPLPKRQRATFALLVASVVTTGQARSMAIATTLAQWLAIRLDSGMNRLYRFLRNPRFDELAFAQAWARMLCRDPRRPLLVAVDWTEWHHELRLLVAAVVTGQRAVPLLVHGFGRLVRVRSQNTRENTFARLLADLLRRAGLRAILLCDRGFRRVSWLRLLQQLDLGFVVRLMDDLTVEVSPGQHTKLCDILLWPGQRCDLGWIPIRSDGAATVRVIGYWAPGAPSPWWIATNQTGHASHILKLYDRRMTIEECFRDTKGCRFGVRLVWTQFRDPEQLARFVMLLAIAVLIWIIIGRCAAALDPWWRLSCRKKGPRQSFVTIGIRLAQTNFDRGPITRMIVAHFLEAPTLRRIGDRAVGGK